MSFFNIMNKFGYGSSLLVGISIFLSEKLENNVALPLIAVLFAIQMLLKINRENFFINKLIFQFSNLLIS